MPDVGLHFADLFLKSCDLGHQLFPHLHDDDHIDHDEKDDDDDDHDDDHEYNEDGHPSHRLLLHLLNLIQVGFSRQLQYIPH